MGKINIDALQPGMVLAGDLFHVDGRLILSKGLSLTPKHLRVLKMWGVASAEIEGLSDAPFPSALEEIDPVLLHKAEELTQKQFTHAPVDHPFMRELFPICTLRRAQRMALQKDSTGEREAAVLEAAPTPPPTPAHPVEIRYKDVAALMDREVALASLPHIFTEINRVISDPRSSAVHVADVISKDPNLTARLLRIVNSAFYGFPSKIDTISRAVAILGSKELNTLALGTSILEMFKDIPEDLVDMKSYWEHSVACGITARMIASYKNIVNTERLFVAGLLHDIGRLLTYKYLPAQAREMLFLAKRTNCLLRSAEMEVLGFDHSQIGAMLMQKWNLPVILEQGVGYHHQPRLSERPLETSIVHIADILINALMIGSSGEHFVPPVIPEVWADLGLSTQIFTKSVQLIDWQVAEVIHNFFEGR